MIEQSRNEKKLLAIERAKFRLKQRLEAIDWEYDHLKPVLSEYKSKAQLPEAPSEILVDVEWEEVDENGDEKEATTGESSASGQA